MSGTTMRLGLLIAVANAFLLGYIAFRTFDHPYSYLNAALAGLIGTYFGIPWAKSQIAANKQPTMHTVMLLAFAYLPAGIALTVAAGSYAVHQALIPLAVLTLFTYMIFKDKPNENEEQEEE